MADWKSALLEPFQLVWIRVISFLPTLVGVVVLLLVGLLVAGFLEKMVIKLLKLIKLDLFSEKCKISEMLKKGDIKFTLSELIGKLIYWIVMLTTILAIANALNLTVAAELLDKVVSYIPNVVAAIFILIIGAFFSTLVGSIVKTASTNVGLGIANVLGKIAQVVIVVFAVATALNQLDIATRVIQLTLSIVLGSLGLGFALAIGLGCKDIAAKYVGQVIDNLKKK